MIDPYRPVSLRAIQAQLALKPPNHQQRARVLNLFHLTPNFSTHPENFISFLILQGYKMTTVVNYAHTLQATRPELRSRLEWRDAMKSVKRRGAQTPAKKPLPATAQEVRALIGNLQNGYQRAIGQMFVTASRLNDVLVWERKKVAGHRYFNLGVYKADRRGRKGHRKWVPPHKRLWKAHGIDPSNSRRINDYLCVQQQQGIISRHLSAHSLRYGAIRFLEMQGWTKQDITKLTLHQTGTFERERRTRSTRTC